MKFLSFQLNSLLKNFRTNIVAGEPKLFLIKIRSVNEIFQISQFKGLSTWPILKFVGKDILKFVGNCRRAQFMVDQQWKTARDQRRVERRMLDNIIQAHAYADLRYE